MKKALVKYSVFLNLIIIIGFSGCGVKGNPVILKSISDNARIVQNFKATVFGDEVILEGEVYSKDSKISYIVIERSESGSAGNECEDCPKIYERIAKISMKEIKKENKEHNNFSITDTKVTHGKIYNYNLLLCDENNSCFKKDATEVNFQ